MAVFTEHLRLVPASSDLITLERDEPGRLWQILRCATPDDWPPPETDLATLTFVGERLTEDPDARGWWSWYLIERLSAQPIGTGGFKGRPDAAGRVELGFSIVPSFQGRGLAGEAVDGLVAWAERHASVRQVLAETRPDAIASMRVLEKCGFSPLGETGSEPGLLRFARTLGRSRSGSRVAP